MWRGIVPGHFALRGRLRAVDPGRTAQVELGDLGILEQLGPRALESVLSEVEDIASGGHPQRPASVLLHHDDRHAGPVDVLDLLEDRLDECRRQPGRGLVQQQHPRVGHQCSSHRHHLALAAAHRPRGLRPTLPEPREQLVHALDLLTGARTVQRAHLQVLLGGQGGEDVVELRHVAEALLAAGMRLGSVDHLAAEEDAAAAGRQQAEDGLDQRRLPGAVGPDHGDDVPLVDAQRDPVEDVDLRHVARDDVLGDEDGAILAPLVHRWSSAATVPEPR
jgi:hypothetical protein